MCIEGELNFYYKKLANDRLLLAGFKFLVAQQFTIQPESVVQAKGLDAVFVCGYPEPASYGWFINGSFVSFGSISQDVSLGPGAGSLFILALPQYNNTIVQCRATDEDDGGTQNFSHEASLIVYGEYYNEMNIDILTTLAGIEPRIVTDGIHSIMIDWSGQNFTTNISYDMDITRMILGSSVQDPLTPVIGLTQTAYTLSYPNHSVCDRFSFTITPTEGGRRGTPSQPVTFFPWSKGMELLCRIYCVDRVEYFSKDKGGHTTVSQSGRESLKLVTFSGMVIQ